MTERLRSATMVGSRTGRAPACEGGAVGALARGEMHSSSGRVVGGTLREHQHCHQHCHSHQHQR
eukprot:8337963-Pyramimonas_sp.AAC.2